MSALADTQTGEDPFILRVEKLSKHYGSTLALRDVSLGIRRGTIHGLLGENGAGKTTLVGIISGQRSPTSGAIYLDGQPIVNVDVKEMEKAGVFLVTQEPMIIAHMTAAENLMLGISVIVIGPLSREIRAHQLSDPLWLHVPDGTQTRILWVHLPEDEAHARIIKRGNPNDAYKLTHWDAYRTRRFSPSPAEYPELIYFDNQAPDDAAIEKLLKTLAG